MPEAFCADIICMAPDEVRRNAALIVQDAMVLDVVSREALGAPDFPVQDFGAQVLAPAPVNAHTHLEFSHLHGRTALGQGFMAWVQSLLLHSAESCSEEALDAAAAILQSCGTAHVADVSSRQPSQAARALELAGVGFTMCAELFGFAPLPEDALPLPAPYLQLPQDYIDMTVGAGHALYSTSPQRLQRAQAWSRDKGRPFFLHLAEHQEEVDLLLHGAGDMAALLRQRVLPKGWQPPGLRPVAYADALGLLGVDTVAVHCVQLDDADVELLAARGVTVCLCPRSNAAIGVGEAPAARLLSAGVPCCLGTDSLASNEDLDIWAELRHILHLTRPKPAEYLHRVLELTSAAAARALGLEHLGALTPGRKALWCLLPEDIAAPVRQGPDVA